MDDVQAVFSDCDPDEMYVMLEAASAVKKSIRVRKLKRNDCDLLPSFAFKTKN